MSITNYSELVTAVASWAKRSDLTSVIPDFIALAESRIYNGGSFTEPLRISSMQNQDTGTISSQVIALPTGYLESIRLAVTAGGFNYPLEYITQTEFSSVEEVSGNPKYYTVLNNAIKTAPNSDIPYIHDYYKKFDALTSGAPTNWLITNAPNVYLYGTLLEAMPYIRDTGQAPIWQAALKEAIDGLNLSEKRKNQANAMRIIPA